MQIKLVIFFLINFWILPLLGLPQTQGSQDGSSIYPGVVQKIIETAVFKGDRHGQFEGDFVAVLSDGSQWKVHPTSRQIYKSWEIGDSVRVKLRTEFYWFKREHKFELYNYSKGQAVKAMLVKHKTAPYSLTIVSTEMYAKSTKLTSETDYVTKVKFDGSTKTETVTHYKTVPAEFRKILSLSDGTIFVIKDHFQNFQLGNKVFIGCQGNPNTWYDFILITGDQREATYTWARPQK